MAADDAVLDINQVTTLRVYAEVMDGQAGNGLYAYALSILADQADIAGTNAVDQLGDPAGWASDPGTILPDGLHDVFGGDGGFFSDPDRGIGAPFELLAIEIQGLNPGQVTFSAYLADVADPIGIPDGILLQRTGSVGVDYDPGTVVTVLPEPTTVGMLVLACLLAGPFRRRKRTCRSIS